MARDRTPPKRRKSGGDSSEIQKASADALGHGITIAASVAIFLLAGDWVDGRLGTSPLFAFLGILFGASTGFYRLYAHLVLIPREEAKRAAEEDSGSEEDPE